MIELPLMQKIDLVEERGGRLYGYEMKWKDKKPKPPKDWIRGHKNATYKIISNENYLEFIT